MRLGEYKLSSYDGCDEDEICQDPIQDIAVDTTVKHESYDDHTKVNDVALVKLTIAADISSKKVETICLPTRREFQIETLSENDKKLMKVTGASWGTSTYYFTLFSFNDQA